MIHPVPKLALSVRQPWAWAIIFARKDIENRSWQATNHGLKQRGRVAIHASKGMTRGEYDEASSFMRETMDICCPSARDLIRGAVIGSVEIIDVVTHSESPWFFGPRGLVLGDPERWTPRPCKGALGYFQWEEGGVLEAPAKWMPPQTTEKGFI
jgi:hypothetical protein